MLDQQISEMTERLAHTDAATIRLQDEAYAAYDAGDDAKGDLLHGRMLRSLNAGTTLSQQLQVLRSPEELDRRVMARLQNLASRARLDAWYRDQAEGLHDDD